MPGKKYCVKCREWFAKGDEYKAHVAEVHPAEVKEKGPLIIFKGSGWTPIFHGEGRHATRETRRTHGEARKNHAANTRRRK